MAARRLRCPRAHNNEINVCCSAAAMINSCGLNNFGICCLPRSRDAFVRMTSPAGRLYGYIRPTLLCRVQAFFKSEARMANKAEDRRWRLLRQASLELNQRDVRLRTRPSPDPIPVPFQSTTFVAAKLLRTDTPGASPTCEKSAYRTDAHSTEFSGLLVGVARLDRMNYVTPHVLRILLVHSCWPHCGQLESQSVIRVNPRFNLWVNALVLV
jgi:hypothetical protein